MKKGSLLLAAVFLLAVAAVSGCARHTNARNGDVVQVHYTLKLADGTIAQSTMGGVPIEFTLGAGDLIAGFDKAVLGMKAGESKTVAIPAAEAYGPHRDELVMEIPRDRLAAGVNPEVGGQLQTTMADGTVVPMTVVAITETTVTVDANAPLAGKDLTFEITLVKIY